MYRDCQTESASKRQREIERGFMELLCKNNYDDMTVSWLCQQLQIPRKAFYRYFSGKDGVLYALIDHTLADFFLMPQTREKAAGTAMGDLELYFIFWYENKKLLDALQRNGLAGILVERANRFAVEEGHLPKQYMRLHPQVRDMAVAFSVCGLMSMILQWHRTGFSIPPEEMTRLAINLLSRPLIPM